MAHLSTLVSTDSRPFLARVRRSKLHQIATGEGIPFPPGAPKTVMLPLLENVAESVLLKYVEVARVTQDDEGGGNHVELYPVEPEHQSAQNQEVVAGVLLERISPSEEQAKEKQADFDSHRLQALEKENAGLKAVISDRLDALENATSAFPLNKLLPWQLIHMAKERGIEYKGLSKEELVAALEA